LFKNLNSYIGEQFNLVHDKLTIEENMTSITTEAWMSKLLQDEPPPLNVRSSRHT
jgi:hypothetical protein